MANNDQYIWLDGKLVPFAEANIHFLNTALHYGLGVFEGIRSYDTDKGPAVFRLKEHMERLVNSAKILGFRQLPFNVDELMSATKELIRANQLKACYIRPLVFHDSPTRNLNLDTGPARIGIAAWEWGAYLGEEALEKGVSMNISSYTRHHPNVMMTKAKVTGNYANSVMAKTEAVRNGFEEAIMLDPQGYVAECTGENIFIVRKNVLYTPGSWAILEGLTRDSILTLAEDLGYKVVETQISRDQLYIADECFVSGTAAELVPVTDIDHRTIGNGKMGPVTRAIQKEFQKVIHNQNARSAEWLDFVN